MPATATVAATAVNAFLRVGLPEAIELAFRIQGNPALRQRLEQLTAFDAIQPEVAKDILRSLRPIAA